MATRQFYATGDFRYGTRMLTAGDGPISMDGPTARLYTALGKISPKKPKLTTMARPDADGSGNIIPAAPVVPAARAATPAKAAAKPRATRKRPAKAK